MTLPRVRLRGGFQRPIGLGEFVRRFMSGQIEAPVLDPDTRAIVDSVRIDPSRGAPPQDIWARYKDFLFTAWGQELMERWRREGRVIPVSEDEQEALQRIARGRIPQRRTSMRLASFYRYFGMLRSLGWVEATGEEEGSLIGGVPGAEVTKQDGTALVRVPQPRRYYRLTRFGLAEPPEGAWRNPLLVLYPERGQDYYRATAEAARKRRGKLPPYRKPRLPEVA